MTGEGTVRDELLSDNETAAPPVDAAAVSVTVQTLVAPDRRVIGEQLREERLAGAVRLMPAVLEAPFNVAVIVTV